MSIVVEKGEKMGNYLIEIYDKKKNKWKYIVFLICAVIAIASSALLGKMLGKIKYENYVQEKTDKDFDMLIDINEEKMSKTKLPFATEEGKNNIKNVYSSTSDNKRVFLTFDDGPSSNVTPLILDVLKQNNIKATFFTLGSRVEQNPQIVKRAYNEGHYIANHGYSHIYSSIYASEENLKNEYNKTENAIRNAIEVPEYSSHLFRFPGGSIGGKYDTVKKQYKKMLDEQGVFYVDWNCLSEDATGNRTKEQLVQFIKDTSVNKNSVVVLMHDAGDKILTYETLQEVIDYFKANGYNFYNFYDLIDYEVM